MKALEHARENFFTTMAHELKTPLANIRAHLTALLSDDLQWSGEARHDMLETADEQVERLVAVLHILAEPGEMHAAGGQLLEPVRRACWNGLGRLGGGLRGGRPRALSRRIGGACQHECCGGDGEGEASGSARSRHQGCCAVPSAGMSGP